MKEALQQAKQFWDEGKSKEALEIYQNLLKNGFPRKKLQIHGILIL